MIRPLRYYHIKRVWEPAPGPQLAMVRALSAHKIQTTKTLGDFLKKHRAPLDVDAIVTNPPYGPGGRQAEAFIRHALSFIQPGRVRLVAMLLRVDFDSAATRTDMFADCLYFSEKIVLLKRINWFPPASGAPGSSTNHAWFIWRGGNSHPPTIDYVREYPQIN